MPSSKQNIIVFVYNSFNDPLFKGLVLFYLKKLATRNLAKFHIITYEQEKYALPKSQKKIIQQELQLINIFWHPLTYHSGKFIMIWKVYDFIIGFFQVVHLWQKFKVKYIFAHMTLAGGFAFIYSRVLRMKYIIYVYEPHSEFMAELGVWNRSSLKYKSLNFLELLIAKFGDIVFTGTQHMVELLQEWRTRGKVIRLPFCVDQIKFSYSETGREIIRNKFNIGIRPCFIYLGKHGDLYYREEIPLFMKTLLNLNPYYFFLIVTPDDLEETTKMYLNAGLKIDSFAVTYGEYQIIEKYISAADMGIVAIPPTPSQKFRSPIKVGEYLLTGIPYIICEGISEDDLVANEYNVGVVLKTFSHEEIHNAYTKINDFLNENKEELRIRCREAGLIYRGSENAERMLSELFTNLKNN